MLGYSRNTFYRYHDLVDEGGEIALHDKSRRKPNLKNRIDDATERSVVQMAFDFPAYGQLRASNELRKNESLSHQQAFVEFGKDTNEKFFKRD